MDNFFITEAWNAAREETDKIRDDELMTIDEKIQAASEAIAARIVSHGRFCRVDGLLEIQALPDDTGPYFFAMGLAIGNLAAWRGIRFYHPASPSQ